MFDNTLIYQTIANNGFGQGESDYQARRQAGWFFWAAYTKGWLHQVWTRWTGCANPLASLNEEMEGQNGRYLGLRTIPIEKIGGSEGRSHDFNAQFLPLQLHNRQRWINIAAAMLRGIPLPPVELIQVNNHYFVRDGNHRISVARWLGQTEIDALVIKL